MAVGDGHVTGAQPPVLGERVRAVCGPKYLAAMVGPLICSSPGARLYQGAPRPSSPMMRINGSTGPDQASSVMEIGCADRS